MTSLAQVLISGLQIGCIYALMALSFYMILSATGILNFAQGEWMMISGVLGVTLLGLGVPYAAALVASIIGAACLAVLAERLVIRPLQRRNASPATTLLALFGIMLVARYGTGRLHGKLDDPLPAPLGTDVIFLTRDIFIFPQTLLVYTVTAALFGAVVLFLRRSTLGRSLRIAAIDPLAASLVGVNLDTVRLVAFASGGLLAGCVAWLYAPLYAAGYMTGVIPGMKGFIALFVGGMISPAGSLVGGLLLGVLEVSASRYLPSVYAQGIAFALLMAVLAVRPRGLLGGAAQT
jgi:branched-chain amino acid transport system permease protein